MSRPNSSAAVRWSIAQVERETGLGKDTLRVWERRYGFPTPLRDAKGERLYPQDQVLRLRLIKLLLDAGHRPGKVVPLSAAKLKTMLRGSQAQARVQGPRPDASVADGALDSPSSWLSWLAQERTDLIRQALQQHFFRQGMGATVEQVVAPLCVQVGQAWLRGELSVYHEHLFSETLQSVLREAIASVDGGGTPHRQPPRVVLTTIPGEQHGLGLLMVECFLAMESCQRYVLGVSTPIADMVAATNKLRIDALALSFSAHASRRVVADSLDQLVAQLPEQVEIWVGGAGAVQHSRFLPQRVSVVRTASEVASRVHDWRLRHPH